MLALKAWRDLAHLRGQSLAIALVIASGVAMLVMAQSTYHSLEGTRARFYADYAFADVWAGAKRAPEALAARLADIPGVQTVETRVAAPATLVLADFADPVRAQVLSLPEDGRAPQLNRLHLRRGRLPLAQGRDEAVVSEAFAEAHGLQPGDALEATLYGRRQRLRLVGIALSQFAPPAPSLFADAREQKGREVAGTLDRLKQRFGAHAVTRAALLPRPPPEPRAGG